jgi:serine/threonine protein kinase/TolB-like protein
MDALIGRTIDKYRLEQQIGQGGMGGVFLAVEPSLGLRAAVKILDPVLGKDPQVSARFFNEARAASLLSHPSVVRVLGFGKLPEEEGGLAYMLMEHLPGETLAARFERQGQRYDRSYVRLVRQVATAMAVVHEAGIIHRDLKLQNLMIVPDPEAPGGERVKILDFGIAKLRKEHYHPDITEIQTRLGSLLGTAVYMSPEQCAGSSELTDRADVYSLGAVFYRLLSGCPLFPDSDLIELVRKQRFVEPVSLSSLAPRLPRGLVLLVHAMLAKDPRRRPSMLQVAAALEEFEDPERLPLTAVPARSAEPDSLAKTVPVQKLQPIERSEEIERTEKDKIGRGQHVSILAEFEAPLTPAVPSSGSTPPAVAAGGGLDLHLGSIRFARGGRGLIFAGVGAALLLALAVAAVLASSFWPRPAHGAAPEKEKGATVAVMPFRDLSGGPANVGEALRETVTADLKGLSGLRVIERDSLDKVLAEQQLQARRADLDASTAARVGKLLGATLIVAGAYQQAAAQVRLTARVIRVETGEIIGTAKVDGKGAELLRLQDRVTAELLRSAGLLPQAKRVAARPRPHVTNLRSMEIYGQALQTRDDQERYTLLKLAVAEDKNFTYAVNDLAALEARLRRYQLAADEATDKALGEILARLSAAKDLTAGGQAVQELFQRLITGRRYRRLILEARAFLDRDLPGPPPPGPHPRELAAFYIIMAQMNLRDWDGLMRDGELFLKRYPSSNFFPNVKTLVEQGISQKRQTEEGRAKAEEALAKTPSMLRWDLCHLGRVYRGARQLREAQRLFRACAEVRAGQPPHPEALRELILTDVELGDFAEARRSLAALEQEDPAAYRAVKFVADQLPVDG